MKHGAAYEHPQVLLVRCQRLERCLEDHDPVGQRQAIATAADGQRHAAVDAEQRAARAQRIFDAGAVLNADIEVVDPLAERLRQRSQRIDDHHLQGLRVDVEHDLNSRTARWSHDQVDPVSRIDTHRPPV